MKKLYILLLLLPAFTALAQDHTLLGNKLESGGYGAPIVKLTVLDGQMAVLVGGYGGWLINHCFLIGGGGYGLANSIEVPQAQLDIYPSYSLPIQKIKFSYGGLFLEYIGNSSRLVHYSLSTLIGSGNIGYRYYNYYQFDPFTNSEGNFFIIEPAINIELNITVFFRINCGVGYRFVSDITPDSYKSIQDLNSSSISISFKFGSF